MKKIKIIEIKIDDTTTKKITVNELTVEQIIELTQTNKLFSGGSTDEKQANLSFVEELSDIGFDIKQAVTLSCDVSFIELKKFTPSELQEIWEGWKEVNSTFLGLLEKMGLLKVIMSILEKAMSGFSETLAI